MKRDWTSIIVIVGIVALFVALFSTTSERHVPRDIESGARL